MKATSVAASNNPPIVESNKCLICKGEFELPYGRWEGGGVCSKECNDAKRQLAQNSQAMHHGVKAA